MADLSRIEKSKIPTPKVPEQARKLLVERKISRPPKQARQRAVEKAQAEEELRIEANNDYNRMYDYPAN